MSDPRCDGCAHWDWGDEGNDWTADGIGYRRCLAVKPRWKVQDEVGHVWDGDDMEQKRSDALKASRAYVQDGSEYRADLVTGPDFFCALHKVLA